MPGRIDRARLTCVLLLLACSAVAAEKTAGPPRPGPSREPAAVVVAEVHRILANCRQTVYRHQTRVDENAGKYEVDCSGLAGYVLQRRLPEHFAAVVAAGGRARPVARDFYALFAASPVTPSSPTGWRKIERVADARPGDLIAWRAVEPKPGSTGHVVFVDGMPEPTADGQVRLAIVDSTGGPHADDTRKPGQSGVGRGHVWFAVDGQGRPIGFRTKSPTGKLLERPTAIGRPVPLESPAGKPAAQCGWPSRCAASPIARRGPARAFP